jgi:hypothetical protein
MVYKAEGDSPRGTTDVVDTEPPTVTATPELERPGDYLDEPLFVQNEEQTQSNLWTKTVISQEDYLNVSQDKLEDDINRYASLVREKRIKMSDVPESLLLLVRSRV